MGRNKQIAVSIPQEAMLYAVKKLTRDNKRAPMIRELQEALDYKSTQPVYYHLTRLKERGLITRVRSKRRSTRIVG